MANIRLIKNLSKPMVHTGKHLGMLSKLRALVKPNQASKIDVLGVLFQHHNVGRGDAYPTHKTIMQETGLGQTRVKAIMADFEESGVLVVSRDRKNNVYYIQFSKLAAFFESILAPFKPKKAEKKSDPISFKKVTPNTLDKSKEIFKTRLTTPIQTKLDAARGSEDERRSIVDLVFKSRKFLATKMGMISGEALHVIQSVIRGEDTAENAISTINDIAEINAIADQTRNDFELACTSNGVKQDIQRREQQKPSNQAVALKGGYTPSDPALAAMF